MLYRFKLYHGTEAEAVATVETDDYAFGQAEIAHYALMYGQDGRPVKVVEETVEWSAREPEEEETDDV